MSTKKTKQPSLILSLVLSFLLAFSLLGTLLCGIGTYALASPSLLVSQLKAQDAAEKVHRSLQTTFETQYNTTAIPAEVYMDVITVDWLETQMEATVTSAYYQIHQGTSVADDALLVVSDAVEAYFETFAAENNYEKDETYQEKLTEMRAAAETTVQNAIDVYHFQMMEKAGIFSKLHTLYQLMQMALIGCAAVSAGLIVWLFLRRHQSGYWIGTSLFVPGLLGTVTAAIVLGSSVIRRFVLKDPASYAVFTGTMTTLTQWVLGLSIAMLTAGILLCGGSIYRTWRQRPTAQASDTP